MSFISPRFSIISYSWSAISTIFLLEKEIESKKKVSHISIEKKEGKYYLSYLKNGLKLYFSKYNLDVFDLLVEFYNENVYDAKVKKAS